MTSSRKVAGAWLRRIAEKDRHDEMLYVAVFLSPMERQTLIKRFGQKHPELHAHHMTIWFYKDGDPPFELADLPLGKTIPLKIVGYVEDEQAQVVIVQPPSKFRPMSGRTAHITISTEKGVLPAYANALIEKARDAGEARKGFPSLGGKMGWWDGRRERYDVPVNPVIPLR